MDTKVLINSFTDFAKQKNVDRPTMIRILQDVFRAMIKKKFEHDENFDIVINATSLGLKTSDNFNIDLSNFKKSMIFIDTIYNPAQTQMLKYFKSNKIKSFNGLNMLIYQGQKSFYLWHKINPEIDDGLIKLLESKLS